MINLSPPPKRKTPQLSRHRVDVWCRRPTRSGVISQVLVVQNGEQSSPTYYHQLMVDQRVTYVLYHSDQDKPDKSDMNSK